MSIVEKVLLKLSDGREVWRITSVRYREADSGRFISEEDLVDPDGVLRPEQELDLDSIEKQILSTLVEIAADPELAGKSSASIRLLLGQVEKLKKEKVESLKQREWFMLGRQLASEVLDMLEDENEENIT